MANVLPSPSASEAIVMGKNIFLYINYGEAATEANPVWTIIGGQRSTSIELTADEIDASHKTSGGWKSNKAGLRGWKFSSEAVVLMSDLGAEGVEKAFTEGQVAQFRIVTKDDAGNIVSASKGWGSVTSFSKEASYDDVSTLSIEISGNGVLTVEGNSVTPTSANFSKADPQDVAFTVTLAGGVSITGVKNGSTALVSGTDYSLVGNVLTIESTYLSALANGTVTFDIECSAFNKMQVSVVVGA